MIQITDRIWIGGSDSETNAGPHFGITAVLNVAQDLQCRRSWPDVEAMHVGLIDGPGNPLTAYYAAVLALDTLLDRHKNVLVCCHGGSRSLAVVFMRMSALTGLSWDGVHELMQERLPIGLPPSHEAHMIAFERIDWILLKRAMKTSK